MARTTTSQAEKPATKTDASNAPSRKTVVHAIQHIEIVVPDAAKARKFFEKQFNWKFNTVKMPAGDYHTFHTPDGNGGGILEPTTPEQPIASTPYINVEDCDTTLRACKKAGAEILMPVTEVPGQGRFFLFAYEGCPPIGCWKSTTASQASRN